jgi:hypothetical protein
LSGNINGDGSLVLKVYYTRNTYTVSSNNGSVGNITNEGAYVYKETFVLTLNAEVSKLGYSFVGWYSGDELLSSDEEYTVAIDRNIEARFEVSPEMQNFQFSSTATTCSITEIKDKTITQLILPHYVTSIGYAAFSGCSGLTSVHISDIAAWCDISFGYYNSNPLYYAENLYLNGELPGFSPDVTRPVNSYCVEHNKDNTVSWTELCEEYKLAHPEEFEEEDEEEDEEEENTDE